MTERESNHNDSSAPPRSGGFSMSGNSLSRRSFMKRTGMASVATIVAMHSLRPEVLAGELYGSSGDIIWEEFEFTVAAPADPNSVFQIAAGGEDEGEALENLREALATMFNGQASGSFASGMTFHRIGSSGEQDISNMESCCIVSDQGGSNPGLNLDGPRLSGPGEGDDNYYVCATLGSNGRKFRVTYYRNV